MLEFSNIFKELISNLSFKKFTLWISSIVGVSKRHDNQKIKSPFSFSILYILKSLLFCQMKFSDRFKIRRKRHGTATLHQPSNRVNRFLSHVSISLISLHPKELSFCHKFKFLIPSSMQPEGVKINFFLNRLSKRNHPNG